MERIKRIRSHTGYARFLANCLFVDTMPRQADIPSPYAYSSEHVVYKYEPTGQNVIIVETAHKQFDVFRVDKS